MDFYDDMCGFVFLGNHLINHIFYCSYFQYIAIEKMQTKPVVFQSGEQIS